MFKKIDIFHVAFCGPKEVVLQASRVYCNGKKSVYS